MVRKKVPIEKYTIFYLYGTWDVSILVNFCGILNAWDACFGQFGGVAHLSSGFFFKLLLLNVYMNIFEIEVIKKNWY